MPIPAHESDVRGDTFIYGDNNDLNARGCHSRSAVRRRYLPRPFRVLLIREQSAESQYSLCTTSATSTKMNAGVENTTPEELEELKEAFGLDKDGDGDLRRTDSRLRHSFSWTGRISADELAFVMHNLGQTASQSEVHGLMRRVDSDGDGTIDLSEFLSAMAKRGKVH